MKRILKSIFAFAAISMIGTACADKLYYGENIEGADRASVAFDGDNITKVYIDSFEGTPKMASASVSIPVKLYGPISKDLTVKVVRKEGLVDKYYPDNKIGYEEFPSDAFAEASVVIPAGKTKGIVEIRLQGVDKFTNEPGYLAGLELKLDGPGVSEANVFGLQYHFINAEQLRSENKGQFSVNVENFEKFHTINVNANDPMGDTALDMMKIPFTLKLTKPAEKDIELDFVADRSLLEAYFDPEEMKEYAGIEASMIEFPKIVIHEGEIEFKSEISFKNTLALDKLPGYFGIYKITSKKEDRKYIDVYGNNYFMIKVLQHPYSIKMSNRRPSYWYQLDMDKISCYFGKSSDKLDKLLDGNKSSDGVDIPMDSDSELRMIFDSGNKVMKIAMYTGDIEKNTVSCKVAVSKDFGSTWMFRGVVELGEYNKNNQYIDFKHIHYEYPEITGVKFYDFSGNSPIQVYELEAYVD